MGHAPNSRLTNIVKTGISAVAQQRRFARLTYLVFAVVANRTRVSIIARLRVWHVKAPTWNIRRTDVICTRIAVVTRQYGITRLTDSIKTLVSNSAYVSVVTSDVVGDKQTPKERIARIVGTWILVIANHQLSDTFPFNTHVVFGAYIVVVTRTFERFVDAYSIHTHVGCARVVVITNHERPNTGPTDATVVYSTGIAVITKQGVIWDQTILISSGDTGHARVERVDGAFFVAVTIYKTPAWVRLMMAISFEGTFTVVVSTIDFIVAEFRQGANALAIFIAGVVVCAGT